MPALRGLAMLVDPPRSSEYSSRARAVDDKPDSTVSDATNWGASRVMFGCGRFAGLQ